MTKTYLYYIVAEDDLQGEIELTDPAKIFVAELAAMIAETIENIGRFIAVDRESYDRIIGETK